MTPLPTSARQRGAGSILVLLAIMVLMTALLAATVLVSGHLARRQAGAAADLAALGAAEYLQAQPTGYRLVTPGGQQMPDPCAIADDIAAANDASLTDCIVDGMEVEVQVAVAVTALRDWLPEQKRRARAGPTERR